MMETLVLYLYSAAFRHNRRVVLQCLHKDVVRNIWYRLFKKCDVEFCVSSGGVRLLANKGTRLQIEALVSQYGTTMLDIRKLDAFVKLLSEGEAFYVFREDKSSMNDRKCAIEVLKHSTKPIHWKKLHDFYFSKNLDSQYTFLSYGFDGIKTYVGEPDKDKRVCRFCGQSGIENFKKDEAHAIPDSLGNKLLICYDECKTCNNKLASIEENFLHMMDFRRSIYRIRRKSKSKTPHVVGENFVINEDGEGNPIIYLKKEAIAPEIDITKPFHHRLKHVDCVTNENIYKALVKFVIDLLPKKELSHFRNTIKWITEGYSWQPDSLPSMLFAVLPDDTLYEQPVIDIIINNKGYHRHSPYCTAILYICDVAYMYVVPLVDVDRGMYKYDTDLAFHWNKMKSIFPGLWIPQDTSDWHKAYPWYDYPIDPSNPLFRILPSSDSVFDKCPRPKIIDKGVEFPKLQKEGIKMKQILEASFINRYMGSPLSMDDLRDVTLHMDSPIFTVLPSRNEVIVTSRFDTADTTDRIPFFEYKAKVLFHLNYFDRNIEVCYDEDNELHSFAFDWQLRDYLFVYTLVVVDNAIAVERNKTCFSPCTSNKLCNNIERIMESSVYLVEDKNNSDVFYRVDGCNVNGIQYQ